MTVVMVKRVRAAVKARPPVGHAAGPENGWCAPQHS
jgi:hypothetical protein